MDVFWGKVFSQFWNFFYGSIERWNSWLADLEAEIDAKEKQIAPVQTASEYHRFPPHAPIQSFDETTFSFNLPSNKKAHFTGDHTADVWIQDFALLNIDIYRLILAQGVLPDLRFVHKRYLRIIKEVHPDKNLNRDYVHQAIQLNAAKEALDQLYNDPTSQITLFRAVFDNKVQNTMVEEEEPAISVVQNVASGQSSEVLLQTPAAQSNGSYLFLFGIGAAVGYYLVKKNVRKLE